MAFIGNMLHTWSRATGIGGVPESQARKNQAAAERPPPVPDANVALNNSQSATDAMRQRRGLLANIYAGASNSQPVSGSTTLGT